MYLSLISKDRLVEIVDTIFREITNQEITLFIKCEFLEELFYCQIEYSDIKTTLFATSKKIGFFFNKLDIIILDQDNLPNHIEMIVNICENIKCEKIQFLGLGGAIQKFKTLKDAAVVKSFKQISELSSLKEFRESLIAEHFKQKIIIEVDYKLLRAFLFKFMHEKTYFSKVFVIIRITDSDQDSSQSKLFLKLIKINAFCYKIQERNYDIGIDYQFSEKEYDQIHNIYQLRMLTNEIYLVHPTKKNTKILTQYCTKANREYDNQVKKKEYYFSYKKSDFFRKNTKLNSFYGYLKLMSISQQVSLLYISDLNSILKQDESEHSEIQPESQMYQVASYLFSSRKIQDGKLIIHFDHDKENNFDFFVKLECLPSIRLEIKEKDDLFSINIRAYQNQYYSELNIQKYQVILKEIAYDKKDLSKCLHFYEKLIKISYLSYESVQGEQVQKIVQEIEQAQFIKKININIPPTISLEKYLEYLVIIRSLHNIQALHLDMKWNMNEMDTYFSNEQIINEIKKYCPQLELLSTNINNPEQIKDILEHYNYKLQYKDSQFEILKVMNSGLEYNQLKFSLTNDYLFFFEQVFLNYSKQYPKQRPQQLDNQNSQLLEDQDQEKKEWRYTLNLHVIAGKSNEKVSWILQKFMSDLDYIDYYHSSEKQFQKSFDTFEICKVDNIQFYQQILPKTMKKLILNEDWNRKIYLMLEMLSSTERQVELLKLNLIMYTYEDTLYQRIQSINYKFLHVDIYYSEIRLYNLNQVHESLAKNNFFSDLRAVQLDMELHVRLQYLENKGDVLKILQIIKNIQDKSFKVNSKIEGKQKIPRKFLYIKNRVSLFQRIYSSFKSMKKNNQLQNFRNDIISHICEMY